MLKTIIVNLISVWAIITYCLWKYTMFKEYLAICGYSVDWENITLSKKGRKENIKFISDDEYPIPFYLKLTNHFIYIFDYSNSDYRATMYFRILPLIWLELGTNCW